MFAIIDYYTPKLCQFNPDAIVVFGDNLIQKGKAGQAVIRDEPNAFGIPTKRLPSMSADSFFSDKQDEYDVVKEQLIFLWGEHEKGKMVFLPQNPIGSGLARLEHCSPVIHKLIDRFYESALKESLKYPGWEEKEKLKQKEEDEKAQAVLDKEVSRLEINEAKLREVQSFSSPTLF